MALCDRINVFKFCVFQRVVASAQHARQATRAAAGN